ncbi:MAG: M20/M25/M40 family metallo-hydrolase [Candidatus Eremiobacteraeota bacterium]|nr:M20/M25/M40 family metallo-hydrolase [Candidatus Eremiobacteraeota bacterium]
MSAAGIFAAAVLLTAAGSRAGLSDALPAVPLDPQIASMVSDVSAERLQAADSTLVGFGTRNDFSETSSSASHGVFAARDWIAAQFQALSAQSDGRLTVRLDTYLQPKTPRTPRAVTESSVIATLRGDEPGRIYVLSSHFDDCDGDCTDGIGVAPGADDNGSGTAAVLEAARVMVKQHFAGTIVFACFDGEELGLWGSGHFAKELRAVRAPVAAVLNNDIIGNSTGGGGASEPQVVRVFSEALPIGASADRVNLIGSENDSPARELSRFVDETASAYVPSMRVRQIFRADRFLRGGDQESFSAQGFAAIRFVESHENFTHQHQNVRLVNGVQFGDLLAFNDWAYLARVTQVNVAALSALALGPGSPGNAQLITKKLGYDSTVRWSPVRGATSYEIVWRATNAANWEFARDVGNVREATVPVSKDDDILGVRALDAQGHRSVVSYPEPLRE